MTISKNWWFRIIQFKRYFLKTKFMKAIDGPLKGYWWSTAYNYDYLLGTYEDPEALEMFMSWLKEGVVLYDLGANIGYYALMASRYIGDGVVYSFEPMPDNIAIFKKHLELNKQLIRKDNIRLLPYAVSDADREVQFSSNNRAMEGNTYIDKSSVFTAASNSFAVQSYSVDSLVKQGYRIPDILKIDVEGAEFDVLKGARQTLQQYHPKILLATHDTHLPGVKDQCISLLTSLGYRIIPVDSSKKAMGGLEDFIAVYG